MLEMLQTVRGFINFMKTNPTTRDQFKSNKLTTCKEYNNEINESEINSCRYSSSSMRTRIQSLMH